MYGYYDNDRRASYSFTNEWDAWCETIKMSNSRWYPDFLPASWNHNKTRYQQFNKVIDRIRENHAENEDVNTIGDFIIQLSKCNKNAMGYGLWKLLYDELKKKQSNLIWSLIDAGNPDNKGFRGLINALLDKLHDDDPVSFTHIYGYKTPIMSQYSDETLNNTHTASMDASTTTVKDIQEPANEEAIIETEQHAIITPTTPPTDAKYNNDCMHYVNADDLFLLMHYDDLGMVCEYIYDDDTMFTIGGAVRFYKSLNPDTYRIAGKNHMRLFKGFTDNPTEYDYYVRINLKQERNYFTNALTMNYFDVMSSDNLKSSALIISDTQKPSVRIRMFKCINEFIEYTNDKNNAEYDAERNPIYKIPEISDDYIVKINKDYREHGILLQYENTDDYIDKWADAISRELHMSTQNGTNPVALFIRKYASIIDVNILVLLQNIYSADWKSESDKNPLIWVRSRKTRRKLLLRSYIESTLQGYPNEFIEQSLKTIKF